MDSQHKADVPVEAPYPYEIGPLTTWVRLAEAKAKRLADAARKAYFFLEYLESTDEIESLLKSLGDALEMYDGLEDRQA